MYNLLLENISHDDLKKYIQEYYSYAKKELSLVRGPKVFLKKDKTNAENILGKTGYYDPQDEKIVLFITNRHAKDILRSFAHELIHHDQKLKGFDEKLDLSITAVDPSYMLHDEGLREMERDAFERGNMMFRTWTDMKKMENKNMLNEKKMSSGEKKKEKEIKKSMSKSDFEKRYPGRGEEVMVATARKQAISTAEASKPDFLDLDKDGDKKEPMKTAAKQAKQGKKMKKNLKKEAQDVDAMMKKSYGPGMSDFADDEEEEDKRMDVDTGEGGVEDLEDLEIDDEEGGEEEEKPKRAKAEPVVKDQDARIANQLRDRYPELYRKLSRELSPVDKYLQRRGSEDMYDEDDYGTKAGRSSPMRGPKGPLPEEQMNENKTNPYPKLFEQRERLLNDAFKTKEERVYNELIRRFIKK